ncbi:hypothetical protein [Streptomyces sp. NPDC051776]|uniref:hypothetical protein n=1 Tax=Streptomyces sp. NPDC051776 TaxID=3155414 RepID=UPI003412C6B1
MARAGRRASVATRRFGWPPRGRLRGRRSRTYGLGVIIGALDALMERGIFERRPVKPLAHVLLGAFNEGALLVAHASGPAAARAEVADTLAYMLERLRLPSA